MAIATPKRKVTMGRRDGQIEIEHGGGGGDVCTAGERVNAASGCGGDGKERCTADWAHGRAEDGRRRESSMARDDCGNCSGDKERLRQR
ncbi:hypothetical protein M0R45_026157 [Rubus argutus]|uniref:Uncharacterized protein n=1 Tax=Rubus argutus TaxID=59490 RepID=A0AAW1WWR5_RUBAR